MENKTQQYIEIEDNYGAHNYHPLDVVISKAEGVWVEDPEGNRYLDCLSAYSAVNQGHRHPRIIAALKAQADLLTLTSRAFRNDKWPIFAKKLAEVTAKEMVLPMNTGAEAVETAIKLARKWGYKKKGVAENQANIICMADNFHGRTTTIVSFSTDPIAKDYYGPYTPGFKVVEFNDIDAIKSAIDPNTVGILVEPIQGEAGVVVPDDGYLKAIGELCAENNVLFICDEVQTGLGRTGKLFAHIYDNVVPDILVLGKALGGGVFPVSAICADKDIMEVITPGTHGSTFGGNPLGCAVALAAVDVLLEENLTQRAFELGEYFIDQLRGMNSDKIELVRGKGLLVGVVIKKSAGKARDYTMKLKDAGILAKETHDYIIRFAPPLTIEKEQLDWALERIRKVFG